MSTIRENAFTGCSSLISIKVDSDNPKYDSREDCNAIIESETNILVAGCQNTLIPDSVTTIGDSAFEGCSGLKSIVIPNNVTSIGNSAFWKCSGLKSVTIPDSVTVIEDFVFRDCTNLTSIIIPDSVTSIEHNAFWDCNSLPDDILEKIREFQN